MERVTGIGGVFFRTRDPEALVAWYAEHLGVPVSEGYVVFPESRDTHWVPFKEDTDYWPAEKQSMVNFTVRNLDAMRAQLRAAGIEVDEKIQEHEFGRFGWATDPEGNRFELWEPLVESGTAEGHVRSPPVQADGVERRLSYAQTKQSLDRFVGRRINVTVMDQSGVSAAYFSGVLEPGTAQGYAQADEKTVYLVTKETDEARSYVASQTMFSIERLDNF